jgi:hypothetical protein
MGVDMPRRGKRPVPGAPPIENVNIRCEQGHPAWRQQTRFDGSKRCRDCPRTVELTLLDGTALTVDPDTVDAVTGWHAGTMVMFKNRPPASVQESRDEVLAKLD